MIHVMNTAITQSMIQAINSCSTISQIRQNLSVLCKPPDGTVYEENSSCGSCITNVFLGFQSQHQLENRTWTKATRTQDITVKTPIDTEYALFLERMKTCGLGHCKACVLTNITQSNLSSNYGDCTATTNVQQDFESSLQSILKQQLTSNNDVLSAMIQTFKNPNVTSLLSDVVNQISVDMFTHMLTGIRSAIQGNQYIQVKSSSNTVVNNVSQSAAFDAVYAMVSQRDYATRLNIQSQLDQIATIIEQNTTLNDVGDAVFGSVITLTESFDSVLGVAIITLFSVLAAVLFFLILLVIYRQTRSQNNAFHTQRLTVLHV